MNTVKDIECPMPYVRAKKDYKQETTKFSYEREVTSTKTVEKVVEKATVQEKETTVELRLRKITLKVYAHSDEEDCEHFLLWNALSSYKRKWLLNG